MKHWRITLAIGFAIGIVLAWVGAAWYAGAQAQQRIEAFVEQVNLGMAEQWPVDEPQPVLRIEDYRRGLFSSDIAYAVVYRDGEGAEQTLRLHDALEHGPLPWSAVRAGEWKPLMAFSHLRLLPAEPGAGGGVPLSVDTRVEFGGSVRALWRLGPGQATSQGVQFDVGPGELTVDYDAQSRQSTAHGEIASLALVAAEAGERLEIHGISLQSERRFGEGAAGQEHHRLQARSVGFQQPDADPVSLADVEGALDSATTGALADARLSWSLGTVKTGEVDLGSLQLALAAHSVDMAALQGLQQAWASIDDSRDEGLSAEEEARLQAALQPLLAAGPTVSIEPLRLSNDRGESQASFDLALMAPPEGAGEDAELGSYLERSIRQARLDVLLSKDMAIETVRRLNPQDAERSAALASMLFDQFAGRLAREGLIQLESGEARLSLRYSAGQVELNGNTMPVADFIAMISPWLMPGT